MSAGVRAFETVFYVVMIITAAVIAHDATLRQLESGLPSCG